MQGKKLSKRTKTAGGNSTEGRQIPSNKTETTRNIGHFTVDLAAKKTVERLLEMQRDEEHS